MSPEVRRRRNKIFAHETNCEIEHASLIALPLSHATKKNNLSVDSKF